MASVSNNLEQAYRQYIETTAWDQYEDHHDTAEYIPELLQQLEKGLEPDEEKELLGELFSRLYYQESLCNAIQVTIYPLLLLCLMDKIKSKEIVLEFMLEIEQRYLFLKTFIGVMPYKYAYLGEFYNGDQAVADSIEKGELPYYQVICQQREWITALFHDTDALVQNLAIKAYGLTAYDEASGQPVWQAGPLTELLNNEQTAANTLITLGLAAQLSRQPLTLPEEITANSRYVAIAKGLSGEADTATVQALMGEQPVTEPNYSFLPWFDGGGQLPTLAALAASYKGDGAITEYLLAQIAQEKKQPQPIFHTDWKKHEVAAEFLALAVYKPLVPSGHKRNAGELTAEQSDLLKKLSARQKIITSTQVIAGLPETIKEVNSFAGLAV